MAVLTKAMASLVICLCGCISVIASPDGISAGAGGVTNVDVFLEIQWYGPSTRSMPEVGFASENRQNSLKEWGKKGPRRWVAVLSSGECKAITQYVEGGRLGIAPVMSAPGAAVQQYVIIWRLGDSESKYFPIGWAETSTVKVLKGVQHCFGNEAGKTLDHVLEKTGGRQRPYVSTGRN